MGVKVLIAILIIVLCLLQYRLWFGDGNVLVSRRYQQRIDELEQEARRLRGRNQILRAEVENLTKNTEAIEERARQDLGMIRKGEIFFQIIEE